MNQRMLMNLQGLTFTEEQAREYYGHRFETTELVWVTIDEDGQVLAYNPDDAQAKAKAVYAKREELVRSMAEAGCIRPADLAKLDRLGRFTVAKDHWGICDPFVREALLIDHAHVQSAARQSQRKAQN